MAFGSIPIPVLGRAEARAALTRARRRRRGGRQAYGAALPARFQYLDDPARGGMGGGGAPPAPPPPLTVAPTRVPTVNSLPPSLAGTPLADYCPRVTGYRGMRSPPHARPLRAGGWR
jgi:hypothetical protein